MYAVKNRIFLDFSKTQKSSVCNHLRSLVKNAVSQEEIVFNPDFEIDKSGDFILDKFVDDESYYLELESSRFPFLAEFIENEEFIKDCRLYIKECIKYYQHKKAQEPLIIKQKEFEKKKRKFLQEVKMSKEEPSKKQISYYKSLCKRYNIERVETKELSKLDLKNMIEKIIDEHKTD